MIEKQYKYFKTLNILYRKKLASLLPVNKNNRYQKFIILTSPRSGSTLLHTYLNSHLNVKSLGENPWRQLEQKSTPEYYGLQPNIIHAVGFKVFYQFCEQEPYNTVYEQLIHDHSIKVIHLTRNNLLKQFISLKIAWQEREWSNQRTTRKKIKLNLSQEEIQQHLEGHMRWEQRCLQDFRNHKTLTVSFEAMTQESSTFLDIQRFLGIKERRLFSILQPQPPLVLEKVITNLDDVKSWFPNYFPRVGLPLPK